MIVSLFAHRIQLIHCNYQFELNLKLSHTHSHIMAKLVKLFIIFGPVQGNIKVIKKYANPGQTIDESLMSTLCLPRIELLDEPEPPKFQTFLVTKEDGHVLYGSGLIVYDRHHEPPPYPGAGRFATYCYTIITDTPFINATRSLLHLIWEKKCDDIIVRSIMNIPLPARRRCLRIVPPMITNNSQITSITSQASSSNFNLVNTDNQAQNNNNNNNNSSSRYNLNQYQKTIDDIYLYRGMTDLPLLDYPLRELFSFLHIDDFLLAFACILMEFRTLIISQDNYKLMMVGETLTSFLLPLKWCNVYVPILPPIYGATYLDAPTSYIMGINTQVTELPENLNHVQCRIYCDESRVVCDANSLALPLFLNDIKKDIMKIESEFQALHASKPFNYLDDLKFNRAIRVLFIKTIRKNILANYERYILDVPESSSDIRQFDVVSYLSDQPEFMYSFLSKFLDTQLFASFIDENAKRMQQSWLSIFDMDPEELSVHFTDKALETAFQAAHRIHLMDLRDEHPDIEIKTVPASPMKLRRRVPGLASIASHLSNKAKKWSTNSSTSIDIHDTNNGNVARVSHQQITSSPPIHRNSVATVSLQGHLSLNQNLHSSPMNSANRDNINSNITSSNSHSSLKPSALPIVQPTPNGKIIELINEVKDLTKGILVENMGSTDLSHQQANSIVKNKKAQGFYNGGGSGTNNNLIGSLCDLIERVWAHGAFVSHQDNNACCPLWNHLVAFTRLKYLDSKPSKHEFSDGSHLNVLSPALKSETNELDQMIVHQNQSNLFGHTFNWFKSNRFEQIGPLARDLINDLKTIHTLKDVKTDIGKARAFIRLSLELKKLSKHLKTLLGDQALLNSLYKPYAFLRCEEEREQFLMYLLTLNAVDLPCFTTTFVNVINTRKMKATTA